MCSLRQTFGGGPLPKQPMGTCDRRDANLDSPSFGVYPRDFHAIVRQCIECTRKAETWQCNAWQHHRGLVVSARQRYQNHDVVDAEVVHCSRRIAQLRRSYFARYGWESYRFEGSPPSRLTMEAAGEIAAFLRTQFGCGTKNATANIRCLSEDDGEIIFVLNLTKLDVTYLMYLHYTEERYQQRSSV